MEGVIKRRGKKSLRFYYERRKGPKKRIGKLEAKERNKEKESVPQL